MSYILNPDGTVMIRSEDKDVSDLRSILNVTERPALGGDLAEIEESNPLLASANHLYKAFSSNSSPALINSAFFAKHGRQGVLLSNNDSGRGSGTIAEIQKDSPFAGALDLNLPSQHITKVKSKYLVNDSYEFDINGAKLLQGETVETIMNYNSTGGDMNIFASEFEMAGGASLKDFNKPYLIAEKLLLSTKILIDSIVKVAAAEAVFAISSNFFDSLNNSNDNAATAENFHIYCGEYGHIDYNAFDSFLFKRLNYPRQKIRAGQDITERLSAFFIGYIEFISGDHIFDFRKFFNDSSRIKKLERNIQDSYGGIIDPIDGTLLMSGPIGSLVIAFVEISTTLTQVSINRLFLLARKFEHEKDWASKLYDAKSIEIKNSSEQSDVFMAGMSYYSFGFIVERMHIGLKLIKYFEQNFSYDSHKTYESSLNRVGLSKSGKKSRSGVFSSVDNYSWELENSGTLISQSIRTRSLPQAFIMPRVFNNYINSNLTSYDAEVSEGLLQNFADKTATSVDGEGTNRLSSELVKSIEKYLDSEYMPFYFHDLRTNEIISFHAFIENISDSFAPEYTTHSGFGRVDDIKHYVKTNRTISLSFTIASTSKEDHDLMWFQINKLVSMVYPQWSAGAPNPNSGQGNKLPFSQVPTNSPLIRLRVGDVIKSNYSDTNLFRKFGINDLDLNETDAKPRKNPFHGEKNTADKYAAPGNDLDEKVYKDYDSNQQVGFRDKPKYDKSTNKLISATSVKKNKVAYCYYLMPGLYRVTEENSGELRLLGAFSSAGTQYIHVKNYEKIKEYYTTPSIPDNDRKQAVPNQKNDVKESFLENREDTKSFVAVTVENKKYNKVVFKCDAYSVIKKEKIKYEGYTYPTNGSTQQDTQPTSTKFMNFRSSNPIKLAYDSSKGKGLAGFITNLDINYNEQLWETSDLRAKAPHIVKVSISYSPIHDIPLGIDSEGMITAPAYNVGSLNNKLFSTVHDEDY